MSWSGETYFRLTAAHLREAGLTWEADRLDAGVRLSRLWGRDPRESAVALGLFGSAEYDRLCELVRRSEEAA